ncbi:hypothetical protein CI15_21345 [Paraburkholderia monticola]|uniref:Lipoprotein n=1 Tax=Paraburkholderia monticola TaxID=1399968 RepID=A0A149PIJ3_9BURK|nr:hypothetical protein [Paraburkholderia monticola]KXU84848.1 hypothetical protein CI15_21345 [Paraburkholderia monticola]
MRRISCIASATLLVLATIALNGCGADDDSSASNASTTAPAPNDVAQQPAIAVNGMPPTAIPYASAPLANDMTSNAASGTVATTDPITQNMQANLAADSQQVAPVMRYAPGDSANN